METTNRNLDGSSPTFAQDRLIHFDEATHTYSVDSIGTLTPVSNVVKMFFKEFDAEYWSLKKCNGDKSEAELLRERWQCAGAFASQAGTFLHKQIEDYLNHRFDGQMRCTVSYEGKRLHLSEEVDVSCEWQYFCDFDRATTYRPFRTEWRVFDTAAGIAGTIDLLCSRDDGTYEIYDWKRSNKIDPTQVNKFASGLHGLEHLTDTTFTHYCLQQNLYRHILEKNYGLRIARMHLVVLHPALEGYRVVQVPRMKHEVATMLKFFKQNH
ncbi:MAG: PD-(D/E)XK nuclease family protein [Muribaculaceae bacterium]|nr:PD-(D/E)XK nuclease family protein [Muribaculaceae bacterium]